MALILQGLGCLKDAVFARPWQHIFCRILPPGGIRPHWAAEQAGFPKTQVTLPFYLIERRLACQIQQLSQEVENCRYDLNMKTAAGCQRRRDQL
jgi:hypothetical protein